MPVSIEPIERATPDLRGALGRLESALSEILHGKPEVVRLALCTVVARGHLLIEDVPGVGKTTLARALARLIGGSFRRIQFTSDLLPSDILGVHVFAQDKGRFEFRHGPIFANVVLADEINRTTPRTQSALLEAMSEGRVSLENQTYDIPTPFVVIATQNPIEHFGTYPLPESQMDRFLLRIRIGYPAPAEERKVVVSPGGPGHDDPTERLKPVVNLLEIQALQAAAARVKVDESLINYAQNVVSETRSSPFLQLGISPRGFQAWFRAAQGLALTHQRDFTVPDDFKDTALSALAHRVIPAGAGPGDSLGRAREESERILTSLIERIPIPS